MPELPEVETMVRGIRPHVEGRVVSRMEFCLCECRPIVTEPEQGIFCRRIQGAIITHAHRIAKRVVLSLNNDHHLVIEPRMTGLMLVTSPPTTAHRRICWHFAPSAGLADSVEFWDRRGLGTVRMITEAQMQELIARLGHDALTMDRDKWADALKGRTLAIKVAMLSQEIVAGIGNLYASEILYRAKISPRKPAGQLSRAALERLSEATIHILNEAIHYEGSTLGDGTYRNALNRNGSYQNKHCVYQKSGNTCERCQRGRIRRIVQSQRSTFYCPVCQRQ